MSWPTPQEYNEAIQTPLISFSDPVLQKGEVELTPIGIPKAMTGAFASVYKLNAADGDWAIRCFLNNRPEQKERYEKISQHVLMDNLEYTVQFYYLSQGIKVRGHWYPVLKMNWVDGPTFESYLLDNYKDTAKVKALREDFARLARGLDDAGMAHGDLQHGNIIVTEDSENIKLKLIDYDAIFVPSLAGKQSLEIGHPNYQHPQRTQHNYDTTADNFSCWLIYNSLSIVEIDSGLVDRFSGGDECILFRQKDLLHPESSRVFNSLLNHDSEKIRDMTTMIIRMLWARPEMVPELHKLEELELLPQVKPIAAPTNKEDSLYLNSSVESKPLNIEDIKSGTRYQQDYNFDIENVDSNSTNRYKDSKGPGLFFKLGTNLRNWLEVLELSTNRPGWIFKRLESGDRYLNAGDYQNAIHQYLRAFKKLNLNEPFDSERQRVIQVCLKLSYPLLKLNQNELAHNYLFIAYKKSCDLYYSVPVARARTAFNLAISRYKKKDEEGAFKILSTDTVLLSELTEILKDPIHKDIVYNPEVLAMILESRETFEQLNKLEDFATYVFESLTIHDEIKESTAVNLDKRLAYTLLFLAFHKYNIGEFELSVNKFEEFVDMVQFFLKKDEQIMDETIVLKNTSLETLLKLANVDSFGPMNSEALTFFRLLLEGIQLKYDDFVKLNADHLESFKPDALQFLLKSTNSQNSRNVILLSDLTIWLLNNRYQYLRECIESVLCDSKNISEITSYIEYLAEKTLFHIYKAFNEKLSASLEAKEILTVGEYLSKQAYPKFIHDHVMEHGNEDQVIKHLYFLDGNSCSKRSLDFTFELVEKRTQGFSLLLLDSLINQGMIDLCKQCFEFHNKTLLPEYNTSGFYRDTILYALLTLNFYGEYATTTYLKDNVATLDRVTLFSFFEVASDNKIDPEYKICTRAFLLLSKNEQRSQLSKLVHLQQFNAIEMIFITLIRKGDKHKIEFLSGHIQWSMGRHKKSKYEHVYIDEYYKLVEQVSLESLYKGGSLKVDEWKASLDEAIEKEYGLRKELEGEIK